MEFAKMNSFNSSFINQTETWKKNETLSNVENLPLKVTLDQTFQTWNDAEKYLNDFALEKGLVFEEKGLKDVLEIW